jgi:predicted nucleotidyltransferase
MSKGCKQTMEAWIAKFVDLLRSSNIGAEVFLHGSVFQGTAITGSDCDISLRFAAGQHLEQVLEVLQHNKHHMRLQDWMEIVGKAVSF